MASDYDNSDLAPQLQNVSPSADTMFITSGNHQLLQIVHAEENNDNQAEFTNPFCTPVQENVAFLTNIGFFVAYAAQQVFSNLSDGRKNGISLMVFKEEVLCCTTRRIRDPDSRQSIYRLRKALIWIETRSETLSDETLKIPDYPKVLLRGTKFLNKTLHAYFKEEGIEHQTSTPRTPEQNDIVERRNRTLVEAARIMLSAFKLPLSFWAEAVATACYT
ncbi:retrovirus-related pol polyprotein from transposon TNT 1-94 [Tanacetum coccineum]